MSTVHTVESSPAPSQLAGVQHDSTSIEPPREVLNAASAGPGPNHADEAQSIAIADTPSHVTEPSSKGVDVNSLDTAMPSISANGRPAPRPSGDTGRQSWRMPTVPPGLATALHSGMSRAKAELRANGVLIGSFVLVLGAGLSIGLAAGGMSQNSQRVAASGLPDAARDVQAMLQWKAPIAIGPAPAQQDNQRTVSDLRAIRASVDALRAGLDDLRGLDKRVSALSQALERVRADATQNSGQLNAQIDRARGETTAAVAQLSSAVKSMDLAAREPAAKIAQIVERLDRIEKGGPLTTASIQAAPSQTSSSQVSSPPQLLQAPQSEPPQAAAGKAKILQGWAVHEVRGNIALLEGPQGMYEVMRGQTMPAIGRIESFERKGRGWQVRTTRGILEPVLR
jgi:hypothetical protein